MPRTVCTPQGAALWDGGPEGRFPMLVVWIRGGSANRRRWARLMRHLALAYTDGDDLTGGDGCGYTAAYVVYGMPQSIRALQELPEPLASWHYVLDVKPPRGGAGTGPVKAPPSRPRPPKPDAPLYGVPRADLVYLRTEEGYVQADRFWVSQDAMTPPK